MKKFFAAIQLVFISVLIPSLAFPVDQIIQWNEKMVGAGHATLADTLNRGFLIQHNADGTHKLISWSLITGVPSFALNENAAITGGTIDNVAITRGTIDNTRIGNSIPLDARVTDLTVTNSGYIPNDISLYFGDNTSTRFTVKRNSATGQFTFTTAQAGTDMTDTNPIFYFNTASTGSIDLAQRIFGLAVTGTQVFYVDGSGNSTQSGQNTASGYRSSLPDGYHAFNDMNTNGYLGTPSWGTTYYDNSLRVRRTFDGQYYRVQSQFVSIPDNAYSSCTPGVWSADNTWRYDCFATNSWSRTRVDNTWGATGGGGTPPAEYTDNFNRTNESPITGNWTQIGSNGGQVNLTDNYVTSSQAAGNQFAFRNSESYQTNQWSRIQMLHNPGTYDDTGGPGVRLQSNTGTQNGYIVSNDNTFAAGLRVWAMYGNPVTWEQVGPTFTGLSLAANDNVTLSISGSVLTVKVNDASIGTRTDPNNRVPSGGTPGFNVRTTNSKWDNWSGGSN